jgi:hypothetical protein
MFPPIPFTNEIREDYCKRVWNVSVREDWPSIQFWGRNISSATNIVFSNGVIFDSVFGFIVPGSNR